MQNFKYLTAQQLTRIMRCEPNRFSKFIHVPDLTLYKKDQKRYPFTKYDPLLSQGNPVPPVLSRPSTETPQQFYENTVTNHFQSLPRKSSLNEGQVAFVVDLYDLPKLDSVFPGAKWGHFEHEGDFFSLSQINWFTEAKWLVRCEYSLVVDTSVDGQLWETLETNNCVRLPNEIGSVDVIVAERGSHHLGTSLSACKWSGYEGNPGFWSKNGVRTSQPVSPPEIIVTKFLNSWDPLESYRLPHPNQTLWENNRAFNIKSQQEHALNIMSKLKQFERCNWFTSEIPVWLLSTSDTTYKGPLVDEGTEHLYVLGCTPTQCFEWITNGEVQCGNVVMVDCKGTAHIGTLKDQPFTYYLPSHKFQQFYDSHSAAHTILFFCNHSSSASPSTAKQYFKWLRETHPDSLQHVMVLDGGMRGLVGRVREEGEEVFKTIFK